MLSHYNKKITLLSRDGIYTKSLLVVTWLNILTCLYNNIRLPLYLIRLKGNTEVVIVSSELKFIFCISLETLLWSMKEDFLQSKLLIKRDLE